ncbi:hypothetical protein ASE23_20280 [Rhizobium sp. Root73]|uniref:DUF3102 domain-containing protein n=1 Tax=unclassified Rhizobium TaxID=2613769 RepID=UPI000725AAC7|nr:MULTISPECIES: DUF3102 domain-containing protein [unclassified Rhizobium]KQY16322.1 hypothetical protein ASD36_22955 [Rhizobium sp. Root1334]KRC12701.1 hypothetical protein ASE23_20280 [Rhizobium sp. Root73]
MTDRFDNNLEDLDFSNTIENIPDGNTPSNSAGTEALAPSISVASGFDYTGVSPEVAEEAEAAADRIRNRHRASIIETGHDLCVIKDKLAHGSFGNWLSHHFGMSERTAQNYMNAATAFGAVPEVVDVLPPTIIYKLAARGAPGEVKQFVIDEIVSGSSPSQKEIESRLAAAKSDERQRREAERMGKLEERAWQKHEQALQAEGKSDLEIEAERKRWATKKAQKERAAQQKVSQAKQREEATVQGEEKMKLIAERAANILKARLGNEYEKFRDAFLKIDHSRLKAALLSA